MLRPRDRGDVAPLPRHRLISQDRKGDRFKGFAIPSQRVEACDRDRRKYGTQMADDSPVADSASAVNHFINLHLDPSMRCPDCFGGPHTTRCKKTLDRQALLLLNRDQLINEGRTELFPPG